MEMKPGFRFPGEWEPMESVMIDWDPGYGFGEYSAEGFNAQDVIVEVIRNLLTVVKVHINCGCGTLAAAKKKLTDAGIDINQIEFVEFETNLSFPRDYGADILVDDKGNRCLVDFDWSTYGSEYDDDFPTQKAKGFAKKHALLCGCVDMVSTDLVSEGGDKEFNGNGVLMTTLTTEVDSRNPKWTKEEVEAEFKKLFNLEKVIWLPCGSWEDEYYFSGVYDVTPEGENVYRCITANGHIDEVCRFVAENEVVLAEISDEEAEVSMAARIQKGRIQQMYDVLKNETDAQGRPIVIHRIPTPAPVYFTAKAGDCIRWFWDMNKEIELPDSMTLLDGTPFPYGNTKMIASMSYCNYLVVNGLVLAQKFWREGLSLEVKERDEKAKQALQDIYPNHKIVTIDTYALNILGGGIHCMTKNVPLAVKREQ